MYNFIIKKQSFRLFFLYNKTPNWEFLIFTELAVIQIIVEAFLGEQLFVRALFNDVTFIHN